MSIAASIANDKLVDLRNKKKLAIQSLNFDAAEENDKQIQIQNELIISDRIEKINIEILKELQRHIKKYAKVYSDIDEYAFQQENSLNLSFQGLFDKAQIQYEKESESIDSSHGTTLLREAEREVPEQMELLERAKQEATQGNYSEARRLREQARTVGENEIRRRKNQIDLEFSQSHSILDQKHQETTNRIDAKYRDEIDSLHSQIELHKRETDQRYDASLKLIKDRAHSKFESLIPDPEVRANAEYELNQKIDTIVRNSKLNPNENFEIPQQKSPAKKKTSRLGNTKSKYPSIP